MRIVIALVLFGITSAGSLAAQRSIVEEKPTRLALVCFFSDDAESGFNRVCYYDCGGSRAAITVKSTQICPLSITRNS